jgi:hypothetical protein
MIISCSCDVYRHPENEKEKDERAQILTRKDCDEPVTVVCSRYERERRKPVSLIRTCQELVVQIPASRKSCLEISKASVSSPGIFSK